MGTFRESIAISALGNGRAERMLDAIVDSGAAYTWLPAPVLRELGIAPAGKRRLKIADGRIIERDVAVVEITVRGGTTPTWVIFGDPGSEPLLGAITLEELSLGIDPVNRALIPVVSLAV